jgi:hypothetical protein
MSPGNLSVSKFLSPHPYLLNPKLWGWGPATTFWQALQVILIPWKLWELAWKFWESLYQTENKIAISAECFYL